jgi:serine/threonine protein kinase/lipopolysaccharide biosynthesis regulator YciM
VVVDFDGPTSASLTHSTTAPYSAFSRASRAQDQSSFPVRHGKEFAWPITRISRQNPNPDLAATLGTERFLQEIKHAARLQHPHILPLYDSGEAGGFLYYVTPFVEGESLRERLDHLGHLDPTTAKQFAREIASALDYAHSQGLVHRDVKPHNILLSSGHVLVADFGIAKALGETSESGMTMTGATLGTPLYMSPEQLEGSEDLDGRSDLYSLACVVFEMLSGEPPFPGKSIEAIVARRLQDPTPSIRLRKGDIQTSIDTALVRAMARDPAQRYGTVTEFATALEEGTGVAGSEAAPAPPAAPKTAKPSIAVLPFGNLSADPENEYFSDGLTEEIIADLSQVRDLRVISRTSSMRYKGGEHDIKTIASELDVHYILEGSVRKAANSLRITAQLIDATTDAHLWAEKYSGTVEDVFDIQEKVSRSIVDSLRVKLTTQESAKLAERPIVDLTAHDLYLRAKQGIWSFTKEGIDRAVEQLEHALAITGDNVTIYQWLAIAQWQYPNAGISSDPIYLEKAEEYAAKVKQMAPDGAEVAMVLGLIEAQKGNMVNLVRHLRRAHAINDTDADIPYWLAIGYIFVGQDANATALIPQALERDPLRGLLQWVAGFIHFLRGEWESAAERVERGRILELETTAYAMQMSQILICKGELDRAADYVEQTTRNRPETTFTHMAHAMIAAARGDREKALGHLTEEVLSITWIDLQYAHFIAQVYALLGDKENMMKWLRQAVASDFLHYPFLAERDPLTAPYRGDPDFQELMAEVKQRWQEIDRELGASPVGPSS